MGPPDYEPLDTLIRIVAWLVALLLPLAIWKLVDLLILLVRAVS